MAGTHYRGEETRDHGVDDIMVLAGGPMGDPTGDATKDQCDRREKERGGGHVGP